MTHVLGGNKGEIYMLEEAVQEEAVQEEAVQEEVVQEEAVQEAVKLVKVKSYKLNFRNKPSTDGGVICLLTENEILEIVEDCNDWYLVKYSNQHGYVMKEYVKEV